MLAAVSALVIGSSVASASGATTQGLKVVARGTNSFVPNGLVQSTLHWAPGTTVVHRGTVVTWTAAGTQVQDEPHTIAIVRKSDLPRSFDQAIFACAICGQIFKALDHHRVVDVGRHGLNQPGDILLLPPGGTVRYPVTAARGTVLQYLCAVHPWMQGVIVVD